MQLCGESLAKKWKRSLPLPIEVCRKVGGDMCRALKFLHALDIAHLDVKPDNIVISDEEGCFKLTDFGLAHEIRAASKDSVEVTSGDARYLPREVLRGESGLNFKKIDLFALGATLLEISGNQPLPSDGPIWQSIRDGIFTHQGAPREHKLMGLITMLMNSDPKKRPDASLVLRQIHF
jgi:serine/threonine protein kinase